MKSIRITVSLVISLMMILGCVCASAENSEWICPGCGASGTANFCTKCGTKRPEEMICPGCGEKYAADSGAIFCGSCGTKLRQEASVRMKYEGPGFDSPEEALACYMEGLKNLDFNQMLSAFAWETQMEHYSVLSRIEYTRTWYQNLHPRMPSLNSFLFSVNLNDLRSSQIDLITRSVEAYILGEDSPGKSSRGMIEFEKDTDQAAEFLNKFDNGRLEKLAQMTNIRFVTPDAVTDDKFSIESNQKSFHRETACYGADETINMVGLANVGDETFYCCPTICRYGGKWYLVSVSSRTSNILGFSVDKQAFACGKGEITDLAR